MKKPIAKRALGLKIDAFLSARQRTGEAALPIDDEHFRLLRREAGLHAHALRSSANIRSLDRRAVARRPDSTGETADYFRTKRMTIGTSPDYSGENAVYLRAIRSFPAAIGSNGPA
ncbi:MAG: hypothetical protein H0W43_02850 [Chthoniobacterales bacterium]|nr:hypothetical protein [Chthoniobacterales bacterium]